MNNPKWTRADLIRLAADAPRDAMERIVRHLWKDQAADFLETSPLEGRDNHLFRSLETVASWLHQQSQGEQTMASPVHKFNVRSVRVAIFENDGKNGPFHSVVVSKLYKDGEQWKETRSFSARDLPSLEAAAKAAQEKIKELEKTRAAEKEKVQVQEVQKEKDSALEK